MKTLGWIIVAVAVIIIAIGAYVVLHSSALLERGIETYGSEYLGAPVEVGKVSVSLSDASARIDHLVVGNPPGFSGPPAISADTIAVTLIPSELSSQLIGMKQVTIQGATVGAVVQGTKSNLQQLMDNLDAQLGPSGQTDTESEVKLIIDRFDFTGASASVTSDVLGATSVDIPDIHLSDIGRKSNGATVGEVLKQVLQPVVQAVMRSVARKGVDLKGAAERLEGNVREKAGEALEGKVPESAGDALKGGLDRLRNAVPKQQSQPQPQQ